MEEAQNWSACLERVGSHGDREAFSALFAHFAPLLKSFLAAGAGQNSENIEELVQDVPCQARVRRPASATAAAAAASTTMTAGDD